MRCSSQRSTSPTSSVDASRHSSSTTASVAARSAGSASSSTMSTLVSGCSNDAGRLGRVVEAEDRRGAQPRRRMRRQASSPSAKVAKPKARRSSAVGDRVDPEAGLGDDPEGALAADEQLGEVRSGRRARSVTPGAHDAAVGEDHLEADHHVLDLPVAGRVLPGAAAGEPSAHGREVHRLGPVAEGEAVTGARPASTSGPKVPARRSATSDSASTVGQAGQTAEVEGDAAEERDRTPTDAAATPGRSDRHPCLVAERRGPRRPGRCRWARHHGRPCRHLAGSGPPDGERPPVAPGLRAVLVVGGNGVAHLVEPAAQSLVDRHLRSAEVVEDRAVVRIDRSDRSGSCHP